ncbi:MAG: N-acetylmuramoyl-L-alanine amidase [Chitinophagaceae bacterium]|nr:N-acetylmuramoyl-L-alanine amidase [Chitinophagaceae bacterium]
MKQFVLLLLLLPGVFASAQRAKKAKANARSAPFYVKTTDSLPFLNYGLGTDRLGGAKMTFLDSNVILKVVDSFGTQYKVQLSSNHNAWIEKRNVKRTIWAFNPPYLSGSWTVRGDSLYDYVSFSLPAKVPYRSRMDINPTRIVIDLFGVVSNTNWITQLATAKEVKNVWYNQEEDDLMRVFIDLEHNYHWGYKIYYDELNRLTVLVKRQPESLLLRDMKIAVDAGHGGDQDGATGVKTGIKEKDYTLLFAKELQTALENRGVTVVMTRDRDTTLSMYERISYLYEEQPHFLISIHFNSASNESVQGVSTYYRYVGFRPLSEAILARMLTLGLNNFGNIGGFNFSLNGPTAFPNCLVEVAFLSNPEDEQKIRDPQFRRDVANKIIDGIEDFLRNAEAGR